MLLLKEGYARRLRDIDKELDSIYNSLFQYKDLMYNWIELSDHLENFNCQILIKKENEKGYSGL